LVNGKEVLTELYYDDGKPTLVRTYKDNMLYDEFKRNSDGSVEPVPGEELAKLKSSQAEMMETIKVGDANHTTHGQH
jgi:hypothetical protein